jgi:hypothetical protein
MSVGRVNSCWCSPARSFFVLRPPGLVTYVSIITPIHIPETMGCKLEITGRYTKMYNKSGNAYTDLQNI